MVYQTPQLRIYGTVAEITTCFAAPYGQTDTVFAGDGTVLGEGLGDNDCYAIYPKDHLSTGDIIVPCYPEGMGIRACPA